MKIRKLNRLFLKLDTDQLDGRRRETRIKRLQRYLVNRLSGKHFDVAYEMLYALWSGHEANGTGLRSGAAASDARCAGIATTDAAGLWMDDFIDTFARDLVTVGV